MSKLYLTGMLVALIAALCVGLAGESHAQKGRSPRAPKMPPGVPKNLPGKASKSFPALNVTDVKPEGEVSLASLLPNGAAQSRLGLTDTHAYRLVEYVAASHAFRFIGYEFATQKQAQFDVKLPKEVKPFTVPPRVAFGGGDVCVVSQQAQVCFVHIKDRKAVAVGDIDSKAPIKESKPVKGGGRGKKGPGEGASVPPSGGEYRVHGLPGGAYALSILRHYDAKARKYVSVDAILYSASGKAVTLKFEHETYGVPPRGKDAVFGVKGDTAVLLVTKPKNTGAFSGEVVLSCLVFDLKTGALKEAQTHPETWGGQDADTFMMAPTGDFFVAQPWGKYDRFVTERGTWKQGYKTDYFDACVGFTPDGSAGIFLGNNTPQRAYLTAVRLADSKDLWRTTVTHDEAMGNGEDEPFTAVGPEARAVAAHFGIIEGTSAGEARFLYKNEGVDFEPLCMSYDQAGKQVAVMALDRLIVLDAKSRTETHSIALEKPLAKGAQGEFVAFSKAGDKVMACVKGAGVWLFDLTKQAVLATMGPLGGDHARPLPDLSAVVFTAPASEGGNLMLQAFGQEKANVHYRAEYEEVQAICLWMDEKGESMLVTERGMGEGNLFLLNKKGEKAETYSVAELEPRVVGDKAVAAFVTKSKNVVLINDISEGGMTLINCTVIEPGKDVPDPVSASFQCTIKLDDLQGRSAYGATAATPYFGALWQGDDKQCHFACPAGVLSVDIAKSSFALSAWSRKPVGVVAVHPKSKEFFVAGNTGLATYKFK